jgi:hypothetical protein
MADPSYLGGVFDKLVDPIRERPVPSLVFFTTLLTAGYLLQNHVPIPEQYRTVLLSFLFAIPFAGFVLSLHRLLVMRDDPSRLKDPSVLEKIKDSFVGRDEDAKELVDAILRSNQVWLNGDSGVGKSRLLQKAVVPEIVKRNIAVAYLNTWRGDWQTAPASTVLANLGAPEDGDVLDGLAKALDSSPLRVIILDQFDEFQIEHRDKFIPDRGQVITRLQLEANNKFISILNSAARARRIRCVFVTRRDVEWGKRAVLFDEAEEFYLKRLAKNVVEGEIGSVISPEAVERPQNGWDALRERLCSDLADDGVLPVQMRFAVLGLDKLRHSLNVSAYLRMGGVPGLISRYIEDEVRRVAGDRTLALALFSLLDRLVTADGNATAPVPQEELLNPISEERRTTALHALEELERRDILRRVTSSDGTVLWRLDHDYLAGPGREISRRQLPEQAELRDRLQRYRAAPPWQKPVKLADPWTVIRLARARFLKELRFGQAASWFLFSVSAFLVLLAGLTYAGFGGYQWLADKDLGRTLFSSFTTGGSRGRTSDLEAKALLRLMASRTTVRKAFLAEALESNENAKRLVTHGFALAIALSQLRSPVANDLYETVLQPKLTNPQSDAPALTLDGAFSLMRSWNIFASLSEQEGQKLATTLADRMTQEKDADTLRYLADGLGALKDKIDSPTAQKLATTLVDRMTQEKDADTLEDLAEGLGALKDKIDSPTAQKLATTLVDRMSQEKDADTLESLADALVVLKDKISLQTIQTAATTLLERISQERDARSLRYLVRGLGALNDKVSLQAIQAAAGTLVERISREKDTDALDYFVSGLKTLKGKIDSPTAQKLATTLVNRMNQEKDASTLESLAEGLGAFKDKVSPQTIQMAVATLVQRISHEKDARSLRYLIRGLVALKDKIDSPSSQKLATILVNRMNQEKDADTLEYLADGLGALNDKVSQQTIQAAAGTLVERMSQEKDTDALDSLVSGLKTLKDKIDSPTAQKLATTLVDRMNQEKDAGTLESLAEGLGALKDKVSPQTIQTAATTLVERMSHEKKARSLDQLARGLNSLKDKIDTPTAQNLATKLVERISQERDSDVLSSLADGLGELPSAGLTQGKLSAVLPAFKLPSAPCDALLAFDYPTQQSELPRQLKNPACRPGDWRHLALRATQLSGQPIAVEKQAKDEHEEDKKVIEVDFARLSDYVWPRQPWYERVNLPFSEVAALVLLVFAAATFALGLIKSRSPFPRSRPS